MLVLSRRVDEKFRLIWGNGLEARITIQRIGQTRVLVGIEAPAGVKVLRDELDRFETVGETIRPDSAA